MTPGNPVCEPDEGLGRCSPRPGRTSPDDQSPRDGRLDLRRLRLGAALDRRPDDATQHRVHGSRPPPLHRPRAAEGHHDEHLRAFFVEVANALPEDDDLLLLGDGEVVGHFAERIRADDEGHGRKRRIEVQKSDPLTAAQLRARTRVFAGSPPRRRLPR